MKRKYVGWILLVLFVIFGVSACTSAPGRGEVPQAAELDIAESEPELEPEADIQPPPSRVELNVYNAAVERVAAARELTMEFNGSELFPREWQSAEDLLYYAADQSDTSSSQDTRDSTFNYLRAAGAFEDLVGITLTRNYQIMEEVLVSARNSVLNAGVLRTAPEYLYQADFVLDGAGWKFEAGDFYGARDDSLMAIAMYNALGVGLDAFYARQDVAVLAQELAPEVFERADIVFENSLDSWDAGNYTAAQSGAHSAYATYLALKAGIDLFLFLE